MHLPRISSEKVLTGVMYMMVMVICVGSAVSAVHWIGGEHARMQIPAPLLCFAVASIHIGSFAGTWFRSRSTNSALRAYTRRGLYGAAAVLWAVAAIPASERYQSLGAGLLVGYLCCAGLLTQAMFMLGDPYSVIDRRPVRDS